MDRLTFIVLALGVITFGAGIFVINQGSTQRAQIKADAVVARAQEHTKRAEGRQDIVDVLGFFRGWRKAPYHD